jgi:hypothetical protein
MKTPIPETTQYDNYLNKKEHVEEDNKLFGETVENKKDSDKFWVGMPEFVQEEKKSFKTIYLHFRNEADFKEFVTRYKDLDKDQVISDKTKSMWYPHLDKDENSLKRWFEE